MTIAAGARLGSYEVLAPLGAGGMGEVYRARDTKLGREVAIKVLPAHLSNDPDALARFEREARAIAALSHPNILAIHDFGEHAGTAYAVMELLEGETLRERLMEGPLSVRRAADFGVQIANGLAAAHAKGIVHRDLKPENVFVTKDGRVKILDFGLARQAAPARGSDTRSPTAAGMTDAGTVLGTVGYMSPEQVRGLPADHRSDLFSFGVVLYEMLSGRRAFQRDTAAETMTAILKEDPPEPSATGAAAIPAGLERIVHHCLEKNPEERFQSARDLAFDLTSSAGVSGISRGVAAAPGRRTLSPAAVIAVVAALAAGLLLGAGLMARLRKPVEAEPIRVRALTFSGRDMEPSASPDGRLIAFTSARDGVSRIWIKQLAGGGEAPLTSGPDRSARFSPDGSSVLFLRDLGTTQALYRIGLVGGEPRKLADDAVEADWSPDGLRIVFVRVRAAPEKVSALTILDTGSGVETVLAQLPDKDIFGPRWSPDGRGIAFVRGDTSANASIWQLVLLDVASRRERALGVPGPASPLGGIAWSGEGKEIYFVRSGSIIGDISGSQGRLVRCDVATGKEQSLLWFAGLFPLSGGAQGVSAHCDIAGPGRVLFDSKPQRQNLRELELCLSNPGRRPCGPPNPQALPGGAAGGARLLTRGSSSDRQPAYSPDGKRVLFSSNRSGNLDLWLLDLESGALRQLTDDAAQDWDPGFTPDGSRIVWSCDRSGHLEIWIANADGSGARQISKDGLDAENPVVTRDGAWVFYWSGNPAKPGIWRIHPDGTGATHLIAGRFSAPEVSPDGRYVLYLDPDRVNQRNTLRLADADSGRALAFTISVPYQLGGPRINFGRERWSADGRSILYVGQDAAGRSGVFSQDFDPGRDTSGTRRPVAGFSQEYWTESLGLSPDGKRVTISTLEESSSIMLAESVPGAMPPARKGMNP
jgi:eukaryotic-like serine/threonine-protein kinase